MAEILREIGMIARALDSISNIEFKEYDLTKGQYLYLVRICENPGIIQEKLAEMIKVDRTTAARAIKKLETNGFIHKKSDANNRKIKKLFPTEKGESIYPMIKKENDYSNQSCFRRTDRGRSSSPGLFTRKGSKKYGGRLGICEEG